MARDSDPRYIFHLTPKFWPKTPWNQCYLKKTNVLWQGVMASDSKAINFTQVVTAEF